MSESSRSSLEAAVAGSSGSYKEHCYREVQKLLAAARYDPLARLNVMGHLRRLNGESKGESEGPSSVAKASSGSRYVRPPSSAPLAPRGTDAQEDEFKAGFWQGCTVGFCFGSMAGVAFGLIVGMACGWAIARQTATEEDERKKGAGGRN